MKKFIRLISIVLMFAILLVACKSENLDKNNKDRQDGRLKVVTTIFPQYDFVKEVAGDKVDLKMLIAPGTETHSYEPSPQDIIDIQNSDLFIYVGGESDSWVEKILKDMNKSQDNILVLMDLVTPLKEELVEGMEKDTHNHGHIEYDEHVWTSVKNDKVIVENIKDKLSKLDGENSQVYKENSENYIKELAKMDERFKEIVAKGSKKPLVFADRFPFLYFAKEYGISYYGAFSGCSTEVEASPATIKFLIDKVKQDNIPVVFYIEFSNEKMADIIVESTQAKKLLFNSGHNVTKKQLEEGISYLDIMESNAVNLEEALG